jgi:hypothetical protein
MSIEMAAFWFAAQVDWNKFTNVSEIHTASIIRAVLVAAVLLIFLP